MGGSVTNTNEDERNGSTSGGVFSVLCNFIINNNGIVFGAAYNNEQCVKHI